MNNITTLKEAVAMGYKIGPERKMQRGYVSRKVYCTGSVHEAGGRRTGELYVLMACFTSSRYCYRAYLIKEA